MFRFSWKRRKETTATQEKRRSGLLSPPSDEKVRAVIQSDTKIVLDEVRFFYGQQFVMQMYYSFERIFFFEAKRFISMTPATSQNYFLQHQNRARTPLMGRSGGKSLLMSDTDGEDVIQPLVKKSELSL